MTFIFVNFELESKHILALIHYTQKGRKNKTISKFGVISRVSTKNWTSSCHQVAHNRSYRTHS